MDYEKFHYSKKSDEIVSQFVTHLSKLAVHCEFPELERELKSAVIQNCNSKHLRYALREDDMTLHKILLIAVENQQNPGKRNRKLHSTVICPPLRECQVYLQKPTPLQANTKSPSTKIKSVLPMLSHFT